MGTNLLGFRLDLQARAVPSSCRGDGGDGASVDDAAELLLLC